MSRPAVPVSSVHTFVGGEEDNSDITVHSIILVQNVKVIFVA